LCAKPSEAPYGDFDFSRNSAATRVNAQGLVENVQILSSNLVQNGDFSEEGVQEISNGSFSQEGAELVTNGDFSSDTNWIKGTGWNISGNSANASNTTSDLYQENVVESGKYYKVTYTISNYVSGTVRVELPSNAFAGTERSANGTYTEILLSGGTIVLFDARTSFTGSIDNVSVREVGQDWTLGTGWSIGEDKAISDGTTENLDQDALTIGKSYKAQFTVSDLTTGALSFRLGGTNEVININSNGTYIVYGVANGVTLRLRSQSGFNGSVTNISVKEVGMDWALGSGWSIGENKVVAVNGNSYGTFQGGVTQTNKNYKVTYTIEDYISGTVNLRMHTLNLETRNSNGTFTEYFTSVGSSLYIQGGNNFNGSITNISVIEITDDTNLPRINYEGFSYDGSGNIVPNSGCGSWLFEPQSTNLITQSELFSDASWTKLSVSITPNSIISPDGTLNASLMSITGGTSDQRIFKNVTYSGTNVVSVFAKAGASNWLSIRIGSSVNKWYDLENGVLGGSTIVGAYVDADIQDYGNGWYRCSLVFTDNFTTSTRFYPADDDLVVTQSSGSVYIWGAQSEQQSYATSYIPTSGSQVTRNQDVCTGGGSLATINSTEGVLYAEIAALADDLTNRYITISDGTANNRLSVFFTTASNKVIFSLYVGGVLQSYISNSSTDITQINKIACKWKENDFALWINGVEVATDTNGITFPVNTLDRLDLSYTITNLFNFYGKTKAVAVWKEALSDAELTELTSN
jgi:hypothetical protein